jgi:MFS family permease
MSPFVLLCIMGGLAIFSSTMSKSPVLPLFMGALKIDVATMGFIAAASTVVGIVVSLPAGILSDIIGRRRVILIAAAVFATAPFLYLAVSLPWHLVLVRIYHGLATAILGPVAMAAVADTFDQGRGERMGWYSSATMVGRSLAPIVGGALIFGEDFRWVYVATGIAGTLALLAALRVPLSTAHPGSVGVALKRERSEIWADIKDILTHRGILATSVIEAVQYFAFGCLEVFLVVFLSEEAGFSPVEIGLLLMVQIVVVTLTKPWMGRLGDRRGRVPMVVAGMVLGGATMAVMTQTQNYLVLGVLIGLFGLGLATVTASSAALVADLSRATNRGGALGVLSSVMDIGHSTGPMAGGLLISAFGYGATFGAVGGVLAAAGLVFALAMRGVSRTSPA